MGSKTLLSCYVLTFNSERRLAKVLESVQGVADEIVIVDSGSKDRTREIAARFGARFLVHEFVDFKSQRTVAIQQCRNLWVLELDSDEELSAALRERIRALKANDFLQASAAPEAFGIRRRWFLLGREVHCFYPSKCPDQPVRLFRKDRISYERSPGIHEAKDGFRLAIRIEEPILHFTCDSIEQMYGKMDLYTTLAAREMAVRGEQGSAWKLFVYPWALWFRWYVLNRGWKDGWLGLIHGRYVRDTVYQKYLKLSFDHKPEAESTRSDSGMMPVKALPQPRKLNP